MTIDEVQQTLKYLPEGVEIKGNVVAVKKFFEAMATGADLLEELKMLREENSEFPIIAKDNYEIGYNKAIDDFKGILTIEKIKKYAESDGFINLNNCTLMIYDIAEQLKAGV